MWHRGLATGIYTTNSPEACQYVAANCEANVLVVENQKQLEKILQVSIIIIIISALARTVLCSDFVKKTGGGGGERNHPHMHFAFVLPNRLKITYLI